MGKVTLLGLKGQIEEVKKRGSRGQVDAPDILVVEMMEGIVDTLLKVGFDNPQIRREPLVERITGAFRVLLDPEAQRIASDLLGLLFQHGFRNVGRVRP